jgi:hypothetical protein
MLTLLARADKTQRNPLARCSIAGSAQRGSRNEIWKGHRRRCGSDCCFYELPSANVFSIYHKNASILKS